MLTRRHLLGTGVMQTGSLLGAVTLLRGSPAVPAEEQRSRSLPPSIAALASMRGRVQPISRAERETRIAKARAAIDGRAKDNAICLAGGTSLELFHAACAGATASAYLRR